QQLYRKESGVERNPATLEAYVSQVIVPTLQRQKKAGAVAIKFEAAYLRALNFAEPREGEAGSTYERALPQGAPGKPGYINLQNYLFRVIAREAGRLGRAIHIHTR